MKFETVFRKDLNKLEYIISIDMLYLPIVGMYIRLRSNSGIGSEYKITSLPADIIENDSIKRTILVKLL